MGRSEGDCDPSRWSKSMVSITQAIGGCETLVTSFFVTWIEIQNQAS